MSDKDHMVTLSDLFFKRDVLFYAHGQKIRGWLWMKDNLCVKKACDHNAITTITTGRYDAHWGQ